MAKPPIKVTFRAGRMAPAMATGPITKMANGFWGPPVMPIKTHICATSKAMCQLALRWSRHQVPFWSRANIALNSAEAPIVSMTGSKARWPKMTSTARTVVD